jgi:hypothetical protein
MLTVLCGVSRTGTPEETMDDVYGEGDGEEGGGRAGGGAEMMRRRWLAEAARGRLECTPGRLLDPGAAGMERLGGPRRWFSPVLKTQAEKVGDAEEEALK